MAEKKKTNAGKTVKSTHKKAPERAKKEKTFPEKTERIVKEEKPKNTVWISIAPFVFFVLAVLFSAFLVIPEKTGFIGAAISDVLTGLFSFAAYTIPFSLLVFVVLYKKDALEGSVAKRIIYSVFFIVLSSMIVGVFNEGPENYSLNDQYAAGMDFSGGGLIGGLLSRILISGFGRVAAGIIITAALIVFVTLLLNVSFSEIAAAVAYLFKKKEEDVEEITEKDEEREEEYFEEPKTVKKKKEVELFTEETPKEAEEEKEEQEETVEEKPLVINDIKKVKVEKEEKEDISETLSNIFDKAEDEKVKRRFEGLEETEEERAETSITLKKSKIETNEEKGEEKKEYGYRFPPLSLLQDEPIKQNADDDVECERNAEKLVETLNSFGVKTTVSHISRGPTITRYELVPDTGVRVRSIVNLVDDIALKLAASGVRIEAPIPGKEAVGIEIPNKSVATVYIRQLLERDEFTKAASKLTACLGMDVAGKPIYCDVAKMPHLLIAGATNMGKSVCINSFLTSLLYKATPDEVRLILIDPKKVEMNIYNGIGHLLVPVVSDPKKAAGSLCWAVNEMEKRYILIQEAGVRNIHSYNELAKKTPGMEPMSQIVIVIDELADLMMTAKDDVESSICRLAQKARAAGMHLIIGTQRPSIDVITGLIKANFPSRIAFTVASQVDSRTILDNSGAEKLIGRGDMLYAPVGVTKPVRVQGAFVSESEVEKITDFIRDTRSAEYNDEVMESIEKEAARCGEKKRIPQLDENESDENDLDSDVMLRPAIEIAIEFGTISTSMLQTKLKLGYARARRIVDMMEERGFIGPYAGSKPREVRITRAQYMEMCMTQDEVPKTSENEEIPF